jgi:hypothetical protein
MTDVIDRAHDVLQEAVPEREDRSPAEERVTRSRGPIKNPVPTLLAVTLGASAVMLFSMASGHLTGAKAALGIAAALVQSLAVLLVLTRPSRALYGAVAAVNAAVLVFWGVVRGSHQVSLTTAVIGLILSSIALVVALLLAVKPRLGATWDSSTAVFGSLLPLGIVVLAIVGLFGTTEAASAPPRSPTSPTQSASAATALALASSQKVPGESSKTFQSIVAGNDTEKSELQPFAPLNAQDQAVLTQQLTEAYQAAERFPTVASAKAAGMILAGGMAPGVGAHYQAIGNTPFAGFTTDNAPFDPSKPASWIYSSTADNAPVVGIMYESLEQNAPAGFVGPNDHWHQHSNVCVQYAGGKIGVPFAADQNVTPQECKDVHGFFMKKTVWMVHAWVVPGWESPQGVFSHDNLHLYCPGNTDLTNAIGFCDRQS